MKVRSIRKIKPETVYAIKTSTGTYIADGLAHHNCGYCNRWMHGNLGIYAVNIDKKYGEGTAELLIKESLKPHKFTEEELKQIIKVYGEK